VEQWAPIKNADKCQEAAKLMVFCILYDRCQEAAKLMVFSISYDDST